MSLHLRLKRRLQRVPLHPAVVRAGDERRVAGAGEGDDADGPVVLQVSQHLPQVGHDRTVQDVPDLRPVDGADRQAVVDQIFATKDRDSVIGKYSINENGDTSQRNYGVYEIVNGTLKYKQPLQAPELK